MTEQTKEEQIRDNATELLLLKKRKEHVTQQIQTYRFVWWGWIISFLIGAFVVYLIVATISDEVSSIKVVTKTVLGGFLGNFTYVYFIGSFRFLLSNRLRQIEYKLIEAGAVELKETIEENFFTKLVQINFKYLDQYYLQTQEQADKSFRLSAFAAISGLLIVVTGILMMYYGKVEPAYVTTSAGVLSEFIAAIFFYLYNRTILKMSQYHQKLVLTQNISLALKITDDMEKDQKNKALEVIIDRLTIDVNKYLTETKD